MASHAIVAVLGLLLVLATVRAAKPLDDAARDRGFSMFAQMLEKNGITQETDDKLYGTLLAPTDRAVKKFLADMSGMTFEELLARPQLVDLIISYHFVPGVAVTNSTEAHKIISKESKKPTTALTADVNYVLRFVRSPQTGLVTIKDTQGNIASVVVSKPQMVGHVAIWGISSVLMSGAYFDGADDAMRFFPEWSAAYELKSYASAYSGSAMADVFTSTSAMTYLMPSNTALAGRAGGLVKMSDAALSAVMDYHVIPGIQAVPNNFKGVSKFETMLKGHSLKVALNITAQSLNPYTKKMDTVPAVTFTDERGNKAQIELMNIYAGKAVIQGVDGLLVPNSIDVPAAKAASGKRRLQQLNGTGQRAIANQWSGLNTQAAIQAAASGHIPTAYATRAGQANALAAAASCLNCLNWNVMY